MSGLLSSVSNINPFGHLYLVFCKSYHHQPPTGGFGGGFGHGNKTQSSIEVKFQDLSAWQWFIASLWPLDG